jgi:hypothetical protein
VIELDDRRAEGGEAAVARPLQSEDPCELGPFRLSSRLEESPAGIVYLGADAEGRPVEVALLTTAAAGDAAARDRFRTAVAAETPRTGPVPRRPRPPTPGEPAPVVAALVEGSAPWVATAHAEGLPGAGRFLEPVLLGRGWGRRRRGPQFQPHWLSGPRVPAVLAPEPPPPPAADDTRALATAVASLAALLVLLGLLLALLFACEPSQPAPPPPPPTPTITGQPSPPQSPTPATTTPAPSPTRGTHPPSRSPMPRPTSTGGDGTLNPASRHG